MFKSIWKEMPTFMKVWWVIGATTSIAFVALVFVLLIKLISRL